MISSEPICFFFRYYDDMNSDPTRYFSLQNNSDIENNRCIGKILITDLISGIVRTSLTHQIKFS